MTNLKLRLAYLDAALTGKDWGTVQHTGRDNVADDLFIEGREYYLSDGGYSRVCWNASTGKLFLTSNSREQVKALWNGEAAAEIRAEVETECKRLFAEWAGEPWQEGIA